jgi:GNAT superfamily N-acetyltransferase
MIRIEKTEISGIKDLRKKYLDSLIVFQELYLELMIQESSYYHIFCGDNLVGYTIVAPDNILIEFYIHDEYVPRGKEIFSEIINNLNINNIYCKSFDSLLLNFCLLGSYSYTILGNHYRDFHNPGLSRDPRISVRQASLSDIRLLMVQGDDIDELFDTAEQLHTFINTESVFLFHKDNIFAACGTILRVHPDWNYHDLGIWVKKEFRKQGIATQIITWSVGFCKSKNWIPICGCDLENTASIKTLEKCGFVSKYKLIDFKVKENENN